MNTTIFFIILAGLGLVSLAIGRKTSQANKTSTDYYLSGRSLGVMNLTLTFLATQLGGGAIIGTAEAAFKFGWSAIYYVLGLSVGLVVLSLGLGAKFRSLNVSTIPEVFKLVYKSEFLRRCAAILSVVSMFFILVAIGVAARKFLASIGFGSGLVFFGFWAVAILYTVMGGLSAVVKTDVIQVSFIIATFLLISLWLVFAPGGSQPIAPLVNSDPVPWTSWLLMPFLFILIGQDMGQRCFAAKSPKVVSISTASAGVLLFLCGLLPTYLGILASNMNFSGFTDSSVLMQVVLNLTNPVMGSLFACALLMAIISTADSLLCSISLNIALDFPFMRSLSKIWGTSVAKIVTFVVGMGAMTLSYFEGNIIPIMVFAYELSVSVLCVSIIMSLILKSPSKQAAIASMLAGTLGFCVFQVFDAPIAREVISLGMSLISFVVVEFIMRSMRRPEGVVKN